jgi:cobalt transporter subunit CbtB
MLVSNASDRPQVATQSSLATATQSRLAAGALALVLGTFLLYGVGFAGASVLHNAAHDTRHALTFPCH